MVAVPFLCLVFATSQPWWHTDYAAACAQASRDNKDLIIYFRDDSGRLDDALADRAVKKALNRYACLQVAESYKVQGERLLDHPALREMMGQPGLVVVSYHDKQLRAY